MKKTRFFIVTLLVVAAVSVAVISCKKDKQDKVTNNQEYGPDNMDDYLISFKERMLSAKKGEETISLEQARLDLSNVLNFDFGDANYVSNVFQHDTLLVKLSLQNGEVDLYQLAITYNDAVAQVLDAYRKVDLPEKSIYNINCVINPQSGDGNAECQVIMTTRGFALTRKTGFDLTDNWRLDSLRGKCDGTFVGNDHLTMLKQVYSSTKALPQCVNGRVYFTNTRYGYFEGHQFYDYSTPTYNQGYRLWCGYSLSIPNYCVGYNEMTYYLTNLHDILENWMYLDYDEYVTEIELSIVEYNSSNPGGQRANVRCDFEYATANCTNQPPHNDY